MARRPTKAADNPFCKARLEAAKYNEKFFFKEYAAQQLHISAAQLQDYELGITNCIPPDSVLRMADSYNAPELRNIYCREMCPLGCDTPKLELEDLDRISVKALSTFRKMSAAKETLLDIVEDGVVSNDERPELNEVMNTLDEVVSIAQSLRVWAEKNLR